MSNLNALAAHEAGDHLGSIIEHCPLCSMEEETKTLRAAIDTHANELTAVQAEVERLKRALSAEAVSNDDLLVAAQAEALKLREALAKAKRLLVSKPFVGKGYSTQFINDELAALPSTEALREFGLKCIAKAIGYEETDHRLLRDRDNRVLDAVLGEGR